MTKEVKVQKSRSFVATREVKVQKSRSLAGVKEVKVQKRRSSVATKEVKVGARRCLMEMSSRQLLALANLARVVRILHFLTTIPKLLQNSARTALGLRPVGR